MSAADDLKRLTMVQGWLQQAEWSAERAGAQPRPEAIAAVYKCCPACNGVDPRQFPEEDIPTRQIGHLPLCEWQAQMSLLLRDIAIVQAEIRGTP